MLIIDDMIGDYVFAVSLCLEGWDMFIEERFDEVLRSGSSYKALPRYSSFYYEGWSRILQVGANKL